ncbi:MAG: peptide chain release factor 1 [Candidatus Eisenbacteria bacterium]|nr:peptide chain release factor 1 [Candidatus Eisenbacteria bacterium]
MFEKLNDIRNRYDELNELLMDPAVLADRNLLRQYSKERAGIEDVVRAFEEYENVMADISDATDILESADDIEEKEFARAELEDLKPQKDELEERIKQLLIPRDPNDDKNTIVEIRAGTGGEEAALFAADLYRMYTRYAEGKRWKVDVMSSTPSTSGGFKEIIFAVEGDGAYSRFKFESGVHRVQRVPVTESQGRIHTSAATVAVLPEAEEVEVEISPEDIHVDVFRSTGPGGQSVNTTDSAVRITHKPTGLVVTCQDEKSQHKNKVKAMKVLRARLYEAERERQEAEMAEQRRSQVSTGDRSAKIRTYNFPQSRVTDHRIGLTLHGIEQVMGGEIDNLIDALATHFEAEQIANSSS